MNLIDELMNETTIDLNPTLGQNITTVSTTPNKDNITVGNRFETPSTKFQSPRNPFSPNEHHIQVGSKSTFSILKLHALMQKEIPKLVQVTNLIQACNYLEDGLILTPLQAYSKTGLVDLRMASKYFIEQV